MTEIVVFQGRYRIRKCCSLCKNWELCCDGYPILRCGSFDGLRERATILQQIGVLT